MKKFCSLLMLIFGLFVFGSCYSTIDSNRNVRRDYPDSSTIYQVEAKDVFVHSLCRKDGALILVMDVGGKTRFTYVFDKDTEASCIPGRRQE